MGPAFVEDLIASEYGWSRSELREMTFLETHLRLSRIVERRQREAGIEAEPEIDVIDAKGLAGFMQ